MVQSNENQRNFFRKPLKRMQYLRLLVCVAAVICFICGCSNNSVKSDGEKIDDYFLSVSEALNYRNALAELTELDTQVVDGRTYCRLQQNYRGIPVYGRTAVCVTDEQGEILAVTQNVRDIPDDLDPVPSLSPSQAVDALKEHLFSMYPEEDWSDLSNLSLDMNDLCIFDQDGPARLTYVAELDFVRYFLDANTGEVICSVDTITTVDAIFASTGEKFSARRLDDETYILSDEQTDVYVFSANGNTYYNNREMKTYKDNISAVTSKNNVFGDSDDNVSPESMERARKAMHCLNEIRNQYRKLGFDISGEIVIIYDDQMGRPEGDSAYYGNKKLKHIVDKDRLDKWAWDKSSLVHLFGIGTKFSENPEQYLDVFAHEYTHAVTEACVGWLDSDKETAIIDEAYSDIMGVLLKAQYLKTSPDWRVHSRDIAHPKTEGYPVKAWEYGEYDKYEFDSGKITDQAHFYSTVISHAACKMWTGLDDIPGSAISTKDLKILWYSSMLMLPSDANFSDCRSAVTLAAEHMGLTEAQQKGIAAAFDQAGIPDPKKPCELFYQVDEKFTLTVFGDDDLPFPGYRIEIEEYCGIIETFYEKKAHFISEESGEDCNLLLNESKYRVTLTNLSDSSQTIAFDIKVEKGKTNQLKLFTDFSSAQRPESLSVSGENSALQDNSVSALDTSGEAVFRIQRWDRSYRTEDAKSGMDYFYEYVVLEGDNPAYGKINAYIYENVEKFMSYFSGEAVIHDLADNPMIGRYYAQSYVIYNKNGLLCIKISTLDAMGGNTDHVDSESMFFSLETGEIATLSDLTGIDDDLLLPQIRSIALARLKESYGSMLLDSAERKVSNMMLDEFDYYVQEGEIWLHFEKYSVTPGVCGAVYIPTGLYLAGEQAPTDPQ